MDELPNNLTAPVMKVRHADLERVLVGRSGEHVYTEYFRRECPVCDEGILLLRRSIETGMILPEDSCCLCGQRVEFTDIDELNSKTKG